MAGARAVKFCTQVGYIKSYEINEKSLPKGAWLWSCDPFTFLAPRNLWMAGAIDFKFCTLVHFTH